MIYRRLKKLVVLVVLMMLVVMQIPVRAQNTARLIIVPASGSYSKGDLVDVEVRVEDVVDLYGADIQLNFDTAHFEVVDANPSLPGVQITPRSDFMKPDIVVRRIADNTTGVIWYAATQTNPQPPVSGSGILFSFQMKTLLPGDGRVDFSQQLLSTRDADPIPATTTGALYTLSGAGLYLPIVLK